LPSAVPTGKYPKALTGKNSAVYTADRAIMGHTVSKTVIKDHKEESDPLAVQTESDTELQKHKLRSTSVQRTLYSDTSCNTDTLNIQQLC